MHTIRERWLLVFGLLFLLAAGNYIANRTDSLREYATFGVIVLGAITYGIFQRIGWVELFYVPDRFDEPSGSASGVSSAQYGGHVMFVTMTVFYIVYVELTGRLNSPLFCILYIPPLLAGLRYGVVISLGLSLLLTARYFGAQIDHEGLSNAADAVALSFPLSALFGVLLRSRLRWSLISVSEKLTELSSLMDISQMLEMAVDIETTVNLLLINARRIVDADACAVYLLDSGSRSLRLAAPLVDEKSTRFIATLSLKELESGAWRLSSEDVLQLRRSPGSSSVAETFEWPEPKSNAAMVASLIGSEGVLGLLYVARNQFRHPFTARDEMVLKRFTNHVSMPLQKARYQESLSDLAFRDQMTDLSNFRYFERRLIEELIRAKRYHQTVTLVIMDIDHFKKFNDDYGHKAGDALLKQFGNILKDCLRESDLPARYGGEEFIAICPSISHVEARVVAERIRTIFEQTEFELGESLSGRFAKARITISVGYATYPDHAVEPGDLVRQADRALYVAKQRGRNVVVSSDELPSMDSVASERSAA